MTKEINLKKLNKKEVKEIAQSLTDKETESALSQLNKSLLNTIQADIEEKGESAEIYGDYLIFLNTGLETNNIKNSKDNTLLFIKSLPKEYLKKYRDRIQKNIKDKFIDELAEIGLISKQYTKANLEKMTKQEIDLLFLKVKKLYFVQSEIIEKTKEEAIKFLELWKLLKEENNILKQVYKQPENFIQPLTKVMDELTENEDLSKETKIEINPKGKKNPIVKAKLNFTAIEDVLPKNITTYEREIINGIFTIIDSGQNIMTDRQIYEVITGRTIKDYKALKPVKEAITKLRATLLTIDWTEHANFDKKTKEFIKKNNIKTIATNEAIIPAREIIIESGGKKTSGYQLYTTPALLTYAKAVGQISTTPREILQIPDISNTQENLILRDYLQREIEHLNKNKKWQKKIKIQRLIDKGYIKDIHNKARKIKDIEKILNYWKKTGYIKDYQIEKEGRSINAFIIEPNPNYNK